MSLAALQADQVLEYGGNDLKKSFVDGLLAHKFIAVIRLLKLLHKGLVHLTFYEAVSYFLFC